ncbi:NAD(P)/FAD-dependent oxidoreductase [Candidatus Nanohalococcus occultus]|uniref:NAD(P)/FAD-dependent oxidoreductase n=1 Tax=Candidatus Nanohalococcus occultus TaxID=2978047 RepID=UPI0039DFF27D
MTEDVEDLVIVGGSAAALTAAIYAKRSGVSVTVVTDGYGGQINNTDVVENYLGFKSISGPDLAEKYVEHMREYDINEEVGDKVTDIRKVDGVFEVETEGGKVIEGNSVIVCTGGSRRHLNVPGEEEFNNRGVAYCAVCDGPLYEGEEVAVIGGGYAGTEAADYLSDVASKVYLLSRSGELKGEEITIQKVLNDENVEIIRGADTKEFYGENLLDGVRYEQDGKVKELEVTGAFIEIGTVPNSRITDLVETDDSGYIKVNEEFETSTAGLFAAGDVTDKGIQQLSVSSGQGCMAGLNAADYIKQQRHSE